MRPMRPLLEADLDAAYNHAAHLAVNSLNSTQRPVPTQMLSIYVHPDHPGRIERVTACDPASIDALYRTHATKALLTELIKTTLGVASKLAPTPTAGPHPHLVVHVFEAWMIARELGALHNSPPPSKCADRQEALGVMVHTAEHTYGQQMLITTVAGRRHVDYKPLAAHGTGPGTVVVAGGTMTMHQDPYLDDLLKELRNADPWRPDL